MTSMVLVIIATGAPYRALVTPMVTSARQYFKPVADIDYVVFTDDAACAPPGTIAIAHAHAPWPAPTLMRYHAMLAHSDRFSAYDYIFYCDVDMRFVAPVGPEILSPLTATLHPGFVSQRGTYETRPESSAYVAPHEGDVYYCGAFQGGEAADYLAMAAHCAALIDRDAASGLTAIWNDESYWNRVLIDMPPHLTLTPSYCYPDDAPDYYRGLWPESYEPRIVALSRKEAPSQA